MLGIRTSIGVLMLSSADRRKGLMSHSCASQCSLQAMGCVQPRRIAHCGRHGELALHLCFGGREGYQGHSMADKRKLGGIGNQVQQCMFRDECSSVE